MKAWRLNMIKPQPIDHKSHSLAFGIKKVLMYKLDHPPLLSSPADPGVTTAILPAADVPERPLDT